MYQGIGASEGIAFGKVLLLDKEEPIIKKRTIAQADVDGEKQRFANALAQSKEQLQYIQERSKGVMQDIMQTHIMILEDEELIDGVIHRIEQLQDATSAADETISFFAEMMNSLDDEYMRERAADMKDIGYRLVMNLLGKSIPSLSDLREPVILVAHDITPSDTAQMKKDMVLGFLTDIGGTTSHAAIMARTLEIPAILGMDDITKTIQSGDYVAFDGGAGIAYKDPSQEIIAQLNQKKETLAHEKELLQIYKNEKTISLDGHQVELGGNIGNPQDAEMADKNGAQGIGLFRTEFLYMDRDAVPTEEEQYQAYREVLEKMNPRPVVIRTLDIGGDKKLSYLPLPEEMNPFLGYRAIRIGLDQPELFKPQLRALLRASVYGNLQIMYPMISSVEQVRAANLILQECKKELDHENLPYSNNIQVGIMIEIPAAAAAADLFADEVDFFSIGTNDLIQYTCAVDRMNEKIASLYNPFNPAVLRLIQQVIDAAHNNGIWCGMCGEAAGDPRLIPLYLGMGLDEFSMSPSAILKARKQIAGLRYSEMKEMAQKALKIKTADEIQAFIFEESNK